MAHFLSELGLMNYATEMYWPSMVAASAVFAARCTLNKAPLWNETLKLHSGYSQEQLMHVNMNWSCLYYLDFIIIHFYHSINYCLNSIWLCWLQTGIVLDYW